MSHLSQLRAQIAALEGRPPLTAERLDTVAPLGLPALDRVLPWGGLPAGGLHEIRAQNTENPGAAAGFAAFCLGRFARLRRGPLLWVSSRDDLYPPGLAAFGLPVERLLLVRPPNSADLLWTLEEALRCKGVAGLLGDIYGLDFKAARRLSLATRASGVPALLLNRGPALAALLTRWQVTSAPSESPVGVGLWRWSLRLAHCRFLAIGGEEQIIEWLVEAKDATDGFSLVALSQHGSAEQNGWKRAG